MNDPLLQSVTAQTRAQVDRQHRLHMKNFQRRISTVQGHYNCSRARVSGSRGGILEKVTYASGAVHSRIRGLQVCRSWMEFDCSHRKREDERGYLERLLLASVALGFEVDYGVLTLDNEWIETPKFFSQEQEFLRSDEYRSFADELKGDMGIVPKGAAADVPVLSKADAREGFLAARPYLNPNSWEGWEVHKKQDARTKVMRKVLSGNPWTKTKAEHGVVGIIHIKEDTVEPRVNPDGSFNFSHTRVHTTLNVIVIRDPAKAQGTREDFYGAFTARWIEMARQEGYKATAPHQHFQWVQTNKPEAVATLAHYVTKQLALFATPKNRMEREGDSKTIFTPWGVLEYAAETENYSAINWWKNYENSQRNRSPITKTPGLLKKLGIPESDVIRAPQRPVGVEVIAELGFPSLMALSDQPQAQVDLLNAVENSPNSVPALSIIAALDSGTYDCAAA